MAAYYNEHDKFAAAWLRELIKAGHIADGEVDERDIQTVTADDVRGFTQCHFFAGIGGWSYSLRLAGWPDDRPVWTGSCPCQPFSGAGKREGGADNRHLWPHWAELIRQCRPIAVFGEQVESAIAHGWLDLVFDDLEREGYACGAACLPAASVGAPHLRHRIWFVADAGRTRTWRDGRAASGSETEGLGSDGSNRYPHHHTSQFSCAVDSLADSDRGRLESSHTGQRTVSESHAHGAVVGMGDSFDGKRRRIADDAWIESAQRLESERSTAWSKHRTIDCRDGLARIIEPSLQPLAHGIPDRVGRLRGYGNAIVPQVAAAFVTAYLEAR